jgi:3-hydroxyisobutyrate dehydrogenase
MARNLLRAGYRVSAYNRTREKMEALTGEGIRVAGTPAQAAAGAEIVLAMVGDDTASRAVWLGPDGGLAGAAKGSVLIECSTLSLPWIKELASAAAHAGCGFLDAPVTGSKEAAEAGELVLLVGGDPQTLDRASGVLEAVSRRIVHFGAAGSGATMKLINNLMAACQGVALAEGLILAERAGLNLSKVLPALINGAPGSPFVKGKAARMAERDHSDPQFALRWMHKDVSYALDLARELGAFVPVGAMTGEVFRLARNLGYDDADVSAVVEALRVEREPTG